MSIGFRVDSPAVGLDAPLGLTVVARNDSTSRVKALHIEVRQLTKWTARSHKDKKLRIVASVEVPGSELGALQRSEEAGGSRGEDSEVLIRDDLQQQLAAGGGTRYELRVPGDGSLLTLKAETFEVRHELVVRLETGGMSTSSPEVSTPLLVHPGTTSTASAARVEEAAIEPLSGLAEQFATLMDVGADGKMRPAVVPEDAVIATIANELPES